MEIAASARKHGISEEDMLHAWRNHWSSFSGHDPAFTMYVGPGAAGQPLEIGVVSDESSAAVIHAMPARRHFLAGGGTS